MNTSFVRSLFLSPLLLAPVLAQEAPADLGAQIDRLCRPLVDADLAVGFTVGVVDGERELTRGYGLCARGGTAVPDGATIYEIGSVSKVFTALLLADAVPRGEATLDDAVQKHLPDGVVMPSFRDTPVLLWHLATHSSGLPRLPDMGGSDPVDPYAHFTVERLHEVLATAKVRWEPGSKYEYSNFAAGLLGAVLVRTAGTATFDDLLRERITAPLQMNDTAVVLDAARAARLAAPYGADGEPDHTWNLAALAGAGGIRSSVADMLRFARAQFERADTPLGKAITLSQQKRHAGAGGIAVGLGWHIARDGETLWHNGGTGGYHSYLGVQPAKRRAVCILANTSRGEFDALGERILQHLHGIAVEPLAIEVPVAVDRAQLQRLVGTYEMSPEARFEITLAERGLFAQLTDQPALRVYPRSPTEFFYRAVEAALVFELEGDQCKAVVLHQNRQEIRCLRVPAAAK